MKHMFFLFTGLLGAAFVLVCGCSPQQTYVRFSGMALGTTYSVAARVNTDETAGWPARVAAELDRFEASLSTYRPNSVISRLNDNSSNRTDSLFRKVFRASRLVYEASDGLFDITVTPLVNVWGFGFTTTDHHRVEQHVIDSLLHVVGMDKVRLVGDSIVKQVPGLMFNMNAIAKGYAVDVVSTCLKEAGCADFMVEIGGEVRAEGVNPNGRIWRIGIDCPLDNAIPGDSLQAIVSLDGKAMATSGNYRQFFEVDGIRYAHTINPLTGWPVADSLLSVTILADEAMMADAWATACMASGYSGARRLLEARPELEALLIYGGRAEACQVYMTDGFRKLMLPQ